MKTHTHTHMHLPWAFLSVMLTHSDISPTLSSVSTHTLRHIFLSSWRSVVVDLVIHSSSFLYIFYMQELFKFLIVFMCLSLDSWRGRYHCALCCSVTCSGGRLWRRLLGQWVQGDDNTADLWSPAASEPMGNQPPVAESPLAWDKDDQQD